MALVKEKHQRLFETKTDQLRSDIGKDMTVYQEGTLVDCPWCKWDSMLQQGSGTPEDGKTWSSHPNFNNITNVCPNCNNVGRIDSAVTTIVPNLIVIDISGTRIEEGKSTFWPAGTVSVLGKLADIGGSINSNTLKTARKLVLDDIEYKLINITPLGLTRDYLFQAVITTVEKVDLPGSNVLTS